MDNLDEFNFIDDNVFDEMEVDDFDEYTSFDEDFIDDEVVVHRARRSGYYCHNCEKGFTYPIVKFTTQARLFGVETLPNDERIEIKLCPYCHSDEIEEFKNE